MSSTNIREKIIKDLNMTNEEIKLYESHINQIVQAERVCNKLDELHCSNGAFAHQYLYRDENTGKIELGVKYCSKKKNFDLTKFADINLTQINENWFEAFQNIKELKTFTQILDNKFYSGFWLYGDCGVGKSITAYSVIRYLRNKYAVSVGFINCNQWQQNCFAVINNNEKDKYDLDTIQKVKVLVLDDLGSENISQWFYIDKLYKVLDYRMQHNLTTIFTSNYSLDHFVNLKLSKFDDLVAKDRLVERIRVLIKDFEEIRLNGIDLRLNQTNSDLSKKWVNKIINQLRKQNKHENKAIDKIFENNFKSLAVAKIVMNLCNSTTKCGHSSYKQIQAIYSAYKKNKDSVSISTIEKVVKKLKQHNLISHKPTKQYDSNKNTYLKRLTRKEYGSNPFKWCFVFIQTISFWLLDVAWPRLIKKLNSIININPEMDKNLLNC